MASSLSAGILLYRYPRCSPVTGDAEPEVLLVHPGGPMWARRDLGAWSIPKGEVDPGEEPLAAGRREFAEETGSPAPEGEPVALGEVRLKSGKRILAWALAGDLDAAGVVSNTFEMQWPPRSGRMRSFPEVDRAQWFSLQDARARLNPAQAAFVDRVADILDSSTT
jgi:predicted NUDIX family NTP pyrophosphohydrolase